MSRILSVWCPTWPVATWRRKNRNASLPDALPPPPTGPGGDAAQQRSSPQRSGHTPTQPSPLEGEGFALVISEKGVRRLHAVDERAAALGLYAGQKAADAMALVPDLDVADADPQGDLLALGVLADWCVRYSPAVAVDAPDGLFLDVTGVAHLWGGEEAMLDDLIARLAAGGIPARAAIADTAGAAWGLARFGPASFETPALRAPQDDEDGRQKLRHGEERASERVSNHARRWIIAPPGVQAALLEPLPVAALRLDAAAAAQLRRLGLTRVGRVVRLPRAQLARRFGKGVVLRLDQALGRVDEALAFRRPATPWFARLAFAEPISAPDDLARVVHDVLALLCKRLEREGKGARRFEVVFHQLDGKRQTAGAGLSLAGRDAARIARLIAPKLDAVDPGFGIEVVTAVAEGVEAISARQLGLRCSPSGGAAAERLRGLTAQACALEPPPPLRGPSTLEGEDQIAPLVDRLANRLGEGRVFRSAAFESHIPERSVVRRPPLSREAVGGWDVERPRPVRLFRRPEPVEAVAPLPDDPPRLFRWRGRIHMVRKAEGPERIAAEWWRQPIEEVSCDQARDYYRVEDEAGARFWLFRAGLYAEGRTPRWWLHGLFG